MPRLNKQTATIAVLVAFVTLHTTGDLAAGDAVPAESGLYDLQGSATLLVTGEVASPVTASLDAPVRRSLIRREAVLAGEAVRFVGAYRFDGPSLLDLLREVEPHKANQDEFNRALDLVIVVENDGGDRVVLSWGEVFYAARPHRIIIATSAALIVPEKTGEQWPLPTTTRLVCGDDLIAARVLEQPTRLRIVSRRLGIEARKSEHPLHATTIVVHTPGRDPVSLDRMPVDAERISCRTVHYGQGMGYRDLREFTGIRLRDVLSPLVPAGADALRRGYLLVCGADGYRVAITCSELFNRDDHSEHLVVERGDRAGGAFTLFPAMDFYADRGVRSIAGIYYFELD